MNKLRIYLVAFVCSLLYTVGGVSGLQGRVHPSQIQTITLQAGRLTTSRWGKRIPQLQCRGRYCSQAAISSAQCYNQGTDGTAAQWTCNAQMRNGYSFGRIEVNCELYDGPGSGPFYTVGSCGLIYELKNNGGFGGWGGFNYPDNPDYYGGGGFRRNGAFSARRGSLFNGRHIGATGGVLIFGAILLCCCAFICIFASNQHMPRSNGLVLKPANSGRANDPIKV